MGVGPTGETDAQRGEVQRELDEQLRDALRPVTAALAALYVFFVFADWYTMPAPYDRITASLCLVLAFVFLAVHFSLRVWAVRLSRVHPLATVLALLVLGNSLVPLIGLHDPLQTSYLMLLQVGAGIFFLRWLPLAVVLVATDLGWLAAAATVAPDFAWATFGFALLTSTVLAVLAQGVRLRIHRRLAGIVVSERDHRKRLEVAMEAARESQQRYRSLADATSEGVVVVDDERVVDANPAFARLLGWSMAEVLGQRLDVLLSPETRAQLRQVGPRGTSSPVAGAAVRRDGTSFPVELSVQLTPHGGRFLRVIAMRDVRTA